MGVFDDILKQTPIGPSSPKVEVPPGFEVPEPKPLTITPSADIPTILKSSIALAVRLGTSAFVLGWKIDALFYNDDIGGVEGLNKKYSLPLGFINLRDSSSVLENAPRPEKPLILYEYDAV